MLSKLFNTVFGCKHSRCSFPMSIKAGARRSAAAHRTGTYVTCLDCGQEFAYDWQQMKILGNEVDEPAQVLRTEEAS